MNHLPNDGKALQAAGRSTLDTKHTEQYATNVQQPNRGREGNEVTMARAHCLRPATLALSGDLTIVSRRRAIELRERRFSREVDHLDVQLEQDVALVSASQYRRGGGRFTEPSTSLAYRKPCTKTLVPLLASSAQQLFPATFAATAHCRPPWCPGCPLLSELDSRESKRGKFEVGQTIDYHDKTSHQYRSLFQE